jgi:NTP pyrophosphatase (non-canonical NTP hydrolase)
MNQQSLDEVWEKQQSYNDAIRQQHPNKTNSEWLINYILGATSELSDLLQQTNWRNNSIYTVDEFGPNVIEELADVTKYIFSLWQLMGLTPLDMLNSMALKGEILNQILYQETRPPIKNHNILMLDLDGVIADFRQGFMQWVFHTRWAEILVIKEEEIGLHMDIDHSWDYRAYNQAKIEFEREGGYSLLPTIKSVKMAVNTLKRIGWYIIVYTARPYTTYKRIWGDTWLWLKDHDIEVDELHFGYDERVLTASYFLNNNHVAALEDDPTLIKRYVSCNIPVFVYPQPYNRLSFTSPLVTVLSQEQKHWEISNAIHSTLEIANA